MRTGYLVVCALTVLGTMAFAHQGVQNAAVKARMDGMSAIAENLKVIGTMAKGERSFDVVAARDAAAGIARHAAETPSLFEANETDPKSEALPVIWDNYDDFTGKALELESIAKRLAVSISGPADLRPALAELGENCRSCHEDYRE